MNTFMMMPPVGIDMAPEHGRETLEYDSLVDKFSDSQPEWKIRRLAISMSHSEKIETKVILD